MNFKENLANYVLGNIDYPELIRVAGNALEEGYDSEYLAILAGENRLNSNAFEIRNYFLKALNELNIDLPSQKEAAQIILNYYLKKIVSGEIAPQKGVRYIKKCVYDQIKGYEKDKNYLGQYLGIGKLLGLFYEYDDLEEPFIRYQGKEITKKQALEILDEEIISEAKKCLEVSNMS